MSQKWPGGFINKTAPTVVGPTDGEGGSASGIWTLDEVADYKQQGLWPLPAKDRKLFAWGRNASGALGTGNTTSYSSPVQVGALVNWGQSLFVAVNWAGSVKTDGTMWTWGSNSQSQLGTGNTTDYSSPVQIGALTNWLNSAAGHYHSHHVKTDGTLWTWGRGAYGALGLGSTTFYSSPVQVGGLTTWLKISCGYAFSIGINTSGEMYAWGYNGYGYLGQGNTTNTSSPVQIGSQTYWADVACGAVHVLATTTDGKLYAWGYNQQGAIGDGTGGAGTHKSSPVQVGALTTWSKVYANTRSSYAIKTDGTLWVWGKNDFGQLGVGNTTNYSSPVQVGGLTTWNKLGGGANHVLATNTANELYAWGYGGAFGQLGDGTTVSKSSPIQIGSLTTWGELGRGNNGLNSLAILKS